MYEITDLLIMCKEKGASDLHLSAGAPPLLRIHGALTQVDDEIYSKDRIHEMIYEVLTDERKAQFEERHEIDFAIELVEIGRFRVNTFYQRRGESAAFRLIPSRIKSIEELGLPPVVNSLARSKKGLILVTGPTGSGKSTTLASMVDLINQEREDHILTIEDPIEFVHSNKKCLVNQREVGPHTNSFAIALRSALREDPDVILVGEMRDLETIQMAITAAETGHIVFATLHTNSAPQTIDRIIDVFPPHQQQQIRTQLSEALTGVISQTLIPTIDGKGRVVACEIMIATPAIKNLIREGKTHQMPSIIQTGARDGMQSMDQCLKSLVMKNKISKEEASLRAVDKASFGIQTQSAPTPSQSRIGISPSSMQEPIVPPYQQRPI
ncbi:TPA: twitching motility protein PilT [bacterium]|nr:twitching motility protein PilT [bacterium]